MLINVSCISDVKRLTARADKKDPDYIFYNVFEANMSVYSVKPALFDLFLAAGIAAYLGVVYLLLQNFHLIVDMLPKPTTNNNGRNLMSNGRGVHWTIVHDFGWTTYNHICAFVWVSMGKTNENEKLK